LNYTPEGDILRVMAVKKSRRAGEQESISNKPVVPEPEVADGEKLDPQEEKVLDWILKGVVGFILAWLGLSILMVIGGLFHLWG
jgi:hypothetical protein